MTRLRDIRPSDVFYYHEHLKAISFATVACQSVSEQVRSPECLARDALFRRRMHSIIDVC